jgi:signal transduction histidine kinase
VELHKGTVILESAGKNKGSTFKIYIPPRFEEVAAE